MGDRATVIAEEQRAVDHAYRCYERKLADNRGLKKRSWDVTDAAAGTSFIPETPPEVTSDDDLGGQALVFRRVNVTDDGGRTYYIGRRAIRDEKGDLFVVSWQTRAFKQWMRAKRDAPGEVLLRRLLSCTGRQVNDPATSSSPTSSLRIPHCRPLSRGKGPSGCATSCSTTSIEPATVA